MYKKLLAFCLILAGDYALSQMSPVDQQFEEIFNMVSNPGAEYGIHAGWTCSGGTFAKETTTVIKGNASFSWDSDGFGQTCMSDAFTVPLFLKGKRCRIETEYTYASGSDGDISLTVWDGTNPLLTDPATGDPIPLAVKDITSSKLQSHGFTCPESGTVQFRLESEVVNPGEIVWDLVKISNDFRVNRQEDSATLVAQLHYEPAAGCNPAAAATEPSAPSAFPTNANCTAPVADIDNSGGTLDTTDDDTLNAKFSYLPEGIYEVSYDATGTHSVNQTDCTFAITDGTDVRGYHKWSNDDTAASLRVPVSGTAIFKYTTGGAREFNLAASQEAATCRVSVVSDNEHLTYTVKRLPSRGPFDSVNLETQGSDVEITISGSTELSLPVTDQSTPLELTDSDLTLVNKGKINAFIACIDGTDSSGTDCGGSDEAVGFAFTPHVSGEWDVKCGFTNRQQTDADAETLRNTFKIALVENDSDTILQDGDFIFHNGDGLSTYASREPVYIPERFRGLTAGSKVTFKIFNGVEVSGTPNVNSIDWNAVSDDQPNFYCTADAVTENKPQAVALINVPTGGDENGCPDGQTICDGEYDPVCTTTSGGSCETPLVDAKYHRVGNGFSFSMRLIQDGNTTDTSFDWEVAPPSGFGIDWDASTDCYCTVSCTSNKCADARYICEADETADTINMRVLSMSGASANPSFNISGHCSIED